MRVHGVSVLKIVSGGQTGADRAALDFAIDEKIDHGGWVPAGRRAEDGPPAAHYGLRETPSGDYGQRTGWNVRDSDATLLVSLGLLTGGSALTQTFAMRYEKPVFHADCSAMELQGPVEAVRGWLKATQPKVLNVAGPRESTTAGIYEVTRNLLERVFFQE